MKKYIFLLIIFFSWQLTAHKHFILISAPGSGKGTFSQYLVQKYGYEHVCPGDILRDEIRKKTLLGKEILSIIKNGQCVKEAIACKLIARRLKDVLKQNKYFILDGFPLTLACSPQDSFYFLLTFLKKYNLMQNVCFVQFVIDDHTCIKRVLRRFICPKCCMIYNSESVKPKKEGVCDNCRTQLVTRKSDTQKIVKKRVQFFHNKIEPLLNWAKKFCEVKKIDASYPIYILKKIYAILVLKNGQRKPLP